MLFFLSFFVKCYSWHNKFTVDTCWRADPSIERLQVPSSLTTISFHCPTLDWLTQWSLACKKSKSSSVQSSSVCDREETRSSQSSSRSRAFTHFSSCSHCSLTVVRGSWTTNKRNKMEAVEKTHQSYALINTTSKPRCCFWITMQKASRQSQTTARNSTMGSFTQLRC